MPAMSQIANLLDELKRIHNGGAWHGPALREALAGVTAEQATMRPVPGAHSIWELVLHLAAWEKVIGRRLEGQRADEPEEGDFPAAAGATEEAWAQALAQLESAHERLLGLVIGLTDADLERVVVGKGYSSGFMLRGAVNHTAYHAGQIGLLKKALRP